MSETSTTTTQTETREKPGFFKRLFNRIDQTMKEKAEKQASEGSSCCSGDDKDKGGKCC